MGCVSSGKVPILYLGSFFRISNCRLYPLNQQDAVRWDETDIADGGDPYVPYPMAIVFHSLSFISVVVQLQSVFMDVGQLLVATAVHPKKFHQFFQQVSVTTSWTNGFFHLGVFDFILTVAVLGMAMIMCSEVMATIL